MGLIEDEEGHDLKYVYMSWEREREGEEGRERGGWQESESEKRKLHTFDEGSLDRSSNFTTASAILVAMF